MQHTVTTATSNASDSPSSIFEKVPPQPHQLPEITPMRRGRPNRHSKTPSQNINQFDPFSPSQANETVKETDIDDAFGIQAKNQLTGSDDQNSNKARNSMLAFESDFLPTKKEENGGHHSRSVSNASESSTRNEINSNAVSTPKVATATTTGQDDEDLKLRNGVASDIEARLQRLKMSVERPSTPSSTGKIEEKVSNGVSPLLSSTPPPMATSAPPPHASPSPPIIPTRSTSTKPPPPPKPARLRASKQPVSSSSPSSTTPADSQHLAPPTKPARSEQRLQRQPSLSDFEQKFPAIEDIYKNFSTATTTNDTQHK